MICHNSSERVQDMPAALAWARKQYGSMPKLTGIGDAAVWAVFAAAVAPERIELTEKAAFNGTDEEFIKRFFVPGIQRAVCWHAAVTLTSGR